MTDKTKRWLIYAAAGVVVLLLLSGGGYYGASAARDIVHGMVKAQTEAAATQHAAEMLRVQQQVQALELRLLESETKYKALSARIAAKQAQAQAIKEPTTDDETRRRLQSLGFTPLR